MSTLVKKLDWLAGKLVDTKSKYINWKTGVMGGLFAGPINYLINNSHGHVEGLRGGVNQFFFNVGWGLINPKFCEYLAKKIPDTKKAVLVAATVPPATTLVANYLWHHYFGTAEAWDSTWWQLPINMFFQGLMGYRWHKQEYDQEEETETLKNSQISLFL